MNKTLEAAFESAVQDKFIKLKNKLQSNLSAAVLLPPSYDSPLGSPPGGVMGWISDIVEAMIPALRSQAEAEVTANLKAAMEGTNKYYISSGMVDPFRDYRHS